VKAILVVEDDQATRTLLKDALSAVEGWVVTAVADGAKALEALSSVQPHLIVLDVNMPGLDGLEVYRLLRARGGLAEVPVLFVTAEPPASLDGVHGPHRYLAKPFDVDDLLVAAAALLGVEPPDVVG
jgi:two-component system response regulator MprA